MRIFIPPNCLSNTSQAISRKRWIWEGESRLFGGGTSVAWYAEGSTCRTIKALDWT